MRGTGARRCDRMSATHPREDVIEVGPLQVFPEGNLARIGGRALTFSGRELAVLSELARHADRIVTREDLFRQAWGREMRAGDRSVDVYVRKLRVKLQTAMPEWRFIHTHFGFGYRLTAEPQRPRQTNDWFTSE